MDPIEALTTRVSIPQLVEPAPAGEDLDTILRAAVSAPDHGRLRPWRFLVIEGEARTRLGEMWADALARREPEADAEALARETRKPLRAPLVIAVCAIVDPENKIPVIEQVLSAGSAAQNILIASHSLGYGGMWRTGANAYDETVKAALGLEEKDALVGYLYLGTARGRPRVNRDADTTPYVQAWPGG